MKITTVRATSRISTKLKDDFYTFQYCEERQVEDGDDIEQIREELWTTCHAEVDKQVEEIVDIVRKTR